MNKDKLLKELTTFHETHSTIKVELKKVLSLVDRVQNKTELQTLEARAVVLIKNGTDCVKGISSILEEVVRFTNSKVGCKILAALDQNIAGLEAIQRRSTYPK